MRTPNFIFHTPNFFFDTPNFFFDTPKNKMRSRALMAMLSVNIVQSSIMNAAQYSGES